MAKDAYEMAKKQREISVAEFFEKNRHLLGFDNKRKALLTTVKEAVDNSLDACEEARILPEVSIEVIDMQNDRFRVIVEDNGPGVIKKQVPNIFAKLLYGSKFHSLRQSLTADEPIIIKQKDRIMIVKIGEFIDKFIDKEGEVKCNDLEVPSFDWTNYKYSFRPVSCLIKHKRKNEIHKISTSYGKTIKVTGCHSVFTVNKEKLNVEEVQARALRVGDIILAPKNLAIGYIKNEINILDYMQVDTVKKCFWYVYIEKKIISEIFSHATVVHNKKTGDKSRKYYRFIIGNKTVDVLDDSYKQYLKKGFLPVWLVKSLGLKINEGVIRTYQHGKIYDVPVVWPLTSDFMKFIGLFVAEGHTDKRQIAFTFSKSERDLVKLVCNTGFTLGASHTVEERQEKNCVRVKLFGGILSYLFKTWCGHGAKNKKVPDFVFTVSKDLRQDFIDYLYVGDGHNAKTKNQLSLSTVSEQLANQVMYLWLMQGIVSGCSGKMRKGLGKVPSKCFIVSVNGEDITASNYFSTNIKTRRRVHDVNLTLFSKMLGKNISEETVYYLQKLSHFDHNKYYVKRDFGKLFNTNKIGYKLRFMQDTGYLVETSKNCYRLTQTVVSLCERMQKLQKLLSSDFIFLPIKNIEIINNDYEFVYDISVHGSENFVGGFGGLACHNSRGQQGIGISAAALYGQLTTGRPIRITSKVSAKEPAHYFELHINTQQNKPEIMKEETIENWHKEHGTRVELDIEATYQKGGQSTDEYLKEVAIINPHVTIIYTNPKAEQMIFPRAVDELPAEPKEIMPHPYGVELGMLMKMMKWTETRTMQAFLTQEFSRVGPTTAKEICDKAGIPTNFKPSEVNMGMAEKIITAIKETKIMAPPSDCVVPIGEAVLEKGLKKEIKAEFYCAITRPPDVYRGNPFVIEAAIAYGGELQKDKQVEIMRFANRVPLLYQQGACAITDAIEKTNWKPYGLQQSGNYIPTGSAVIVVHLASVWAPFTSEAKEAIAHYPEIIKEIKLALQECGRKLGMYVNKKRRVQDEFQKRSYIEKYLPHIGIALKDLINLNDAQEKKIVETLKQMLEETRSSVELEAVEYDENEESLGLERLKKNEEEEE